MAVPRVRTGLGDPSVTELGDHGGTGVPLTTEDPERWTASRNRPSAVSAVPWSPNTAFHSVA